MTRSASKSTANSSKHLQGLKAHVDEKLGKVIDSVVAKKRKQTEELDRKAHQLAAKIENQKKILTSLKSEKEDSKPDGRLLPQCAKSLEILHNSAIDSFTSDDINVLTRDFNESISKDFRSLYF